VPSFDTSVGLAFFGFAGPDASEDLASLHDRRPPSFDSPTGE
jgi:hypothetical protein